MCMAIRLQQEGIDTFTIYEKAAEVGGTWRENTYPGLECDIPSRYYCFSFAPHADWTRRYSPGPEIQRYMRRVADDFGLRAKIRFGTEITGARFAGGCWHLRAADGEESEADVLVTACGILHHPRYPRIPGLDSFEGATFHSARWDHGVPIEGRRVGVVGTGSTGVQLTVGLSGHATPLKIFQRTPQWILPMPNPRYSKLSRRVLRRAPGLSRRSYRTWQRIMETVFFPGMVQPGWQRRFMGFLCRANLRLVRDPELRRRLTPNDQPLCKRIVVSGRFYQAVQHPNVELVTAPIERVEPRGIVTADGTLHELDVLVLATGFDGHAYVRPMALEVEDGPTLEQAWADDPRAYRTVALAGFPNFFMLVGPHSPYGNQSVITITETQVEYALGWIRRIRDGEVARFAPTEEATRRFNAQIREAMPSTVWVTGCQSWYLGKDGTPNLWPWIPQRHREILGEAAMEDHEVLRAAQPVAGAASSGT